MRVEVEVEVEVEGQRESEREMERGGKGGERRRPSIPYETVLEPPQPCRCSQS